MTSPNEEKNILPEYISVQIGKNKFNIASEYLISSMVQQVIHKNNSLYNSDDYMMVFDVTKIEVTNYLETIISNLLWKPMTSATIAHQYRKVLTKWQEN